MHETALYSTQPNRTMGIICSGDGSEELMPLFVGKFEMSCCLKNMGHYLCEYKDTAYAWVTGRNGFFVWK
jgi:hypothetical protein